MPRLAKALAGSGRLARGRFTIGRKRRRAFYRRRSMMQPRPRFVLARNGQARVSAARVDRISRYLPRYIHGAVGTDVCTYVRTYSLAHRTVDS